jgi:hypothetical protein
VFQEAALAKAAVFLCGQQCIAWDDLLKATSWLSFCQPRAIEGFMSTFILNIAAVHEAFAYGDEISKLALHLRVLLVQMRWCKATDPRDKVYGLLGLATRTGSLVADYSKDVSTVYMETARALIAEHETLEILSIEKCSTSVIDLPSWAPDWSKERDKNQGQRLGERQVPCLCWPEANYRARFKHKRAETERLHNGFDCRRL